MKRAQREETKFEEDSGDDTSNSEESHVRFLFKSALDVGSSFLKIEPEEDDIIFYPTEQGTMLGKVYLENMTPAANVAFLGWTSHSSNFRIEPKYGFIKPGEFIYLDFELLSNDHEKVDQGLYFIKGLPLANTIDIDELEDNIDEVFHYHNQNILFTLSTLSGDHSIDQRAEDVQYDNHIERDNLIYTQEYKEQVEEEQRLQQDKILASQTNKQQEQMVKPEADSSVPEPEDSRSQPRESDLLGLESGSKEEDTSNQCKQNSFVSSYFLKSYINMYLIIP